ncbi:MAG: peptidase M28, partial [Haliea sp.]
MKHRLCRLTLLAAVLLLAACAREQPPTTPASPAEPEVASSDHARIDATRLSEHVKVLASDEFEGRAPGTEGETRTIAFLIEQFEAIGIEPGGVDGSWTQTVPMIHTLLDDAGSLSIR